MKLSIIVAVGRNREIGFENKLLWDLPSDMAHFQKTTTGHVVILGDRTFESIGKPLPNRTSIIVTLNKEYKVPEGCHLVHSIEDAIAKARELAPDDEVFVIGGATIYKLFLPYTEKLYITEVDDDPEADTYFPDYSEFKKVISESEIQEENGIKFVFKELERE
jgi:dihydrofolate reductase